MKDIVVYKDEKFYSAFTDIKKLQNGELLACFRRAPQRKPYSDHCDSESRALLLRSQDNGKTWKDEKILHEEEKNVGTGDPSIVQLKDGTIIANYFSWRFVKEHPFNHRVEGTFIVKSNDNGHTWDKRTVKVGCSGTVCFKTMATSDSILELPGGDLLIPLYGDSGGKSKAFVLKSEDKGETWGGLSIIAEDPFNNISFCEPALCRLPSGKIICMIREVREGGGYLFQSESVDDGNSWSFPKRTDLWGFPAHLLTLKDGRILCTYGYRRPPYGIRACLSCDEGKTWDLRNEIVLRNDGSHGDLGYPSTVELNDNQILTIYYFHTSKPISESSYVHYSQPDGIRFIAGTFYSV